MYIVIPRAITKEITKNIGEKIVRLKCYIGKYSLNTKERRRNTGTKKT